MAKISRNGLKNLVKECLLEILSEGIGAQNRIDRGPKVKTKRSNPKPRASSDRKIDTNLENKRFAEAVDRTVVGLTDDSVLQEIFADTAMNTLQEQTKHDRRPGDITPIENPSESSGGVDLSSIFSSSKDNWSELAFAENKNRTAE